MSAWYTVLIVLGSILVVGVISEIVLRATARKFDPKNKHCYITGGSTGLGKAVAIELAKRGAHITIVARRLEELNKAKTEIESHCTSNCQKVICISSDCTDHDSTVKALDEAIEKHGKVPEYVFTCAGASYPGLFIEQSVDVFEKNMKLNYFGTLYTVHQAVNKMVGSNIKGNVVLVGSTLSMLGLIGYSQYTPTKFAIRGLAESLRNELKAYGINVSVYFPGTILSPGFETENLTKPQITKDIEGADSGLSPEQCAKALIKGLSRGEVAITSDIVSLLFRVSSRGMMPTNNFVLDSILAFVAWIAFIPWRWYADSLVVNYGKSMLSNN
ncbi:hypothetical protein BB558_005239 [Smittium angustum]|uniref:3-dehydrosphinganine reductase n=1 Tax=Smittium angustum TaxID=133377 RepID=A0A2U1J122_SMIAN|nr:hypothetical protein BB558_005239 [Smittium angustum]